MTFKGMIKNTFSDLNQIDLLSVNNLKLILNYSSIGMFFGAILNFFANYLYYGLEIDVIIFSLILLFLGIATIVVSKSKLTPKHQTTYFIISICCLIPVFTFQYIDYASVTIWAFPFVFLIISLLFTNSKMIIYISISIILTQIAVWIVAPEAVIPINGGDHLARIGLFSLTIVIAFFVSGVYIKKFKENITQIQKIENLAYHDHLTALPNRLLFTEQLNHAILLANRLNKPLAILFFDLDDFKRINDSLGHSAGDQLLKDVAQRLVATLRSSDICARIGGDEFIIMIENAEDISGINTVAKKILQIFKEPYNLNKETYFMSASVGIAMYPIDGNDSETLIKNADIAMYQAKQTGKNKHVSFASTMTDIIAQTNMLTNSLYHALERNELELFYQPLVSCVSNQIVGLEALLRWHHPELGMIPPAQFIPIAEKTGLIDPIGEWVLRSACKQIKTWEERGLPRIRVSVNISVYQFRSRNMIVQIEDILNETGLDPTYLELEITESIAIKDPVYIIDTLSAIRKLGVQISIDDFGTEYSSLSYLKQLPLDRLKIAMPFVHGIGISKKDEAIIKAILVLAKSMELNITAEGVESKEQCEYLRHQNCDEIQGFYYYRPMPASEAESLLGQIL
jgi:diguanylate cyclase (GGDEF)-like protein